ncbi:MAG: hypothetical protein ACP6IS_09925 [Candidatus Asgardarchaeia archaeon]
MVSTITVSDEIRRKIKRLAALLDTTQNKIVEQAISLFEQEIMARKREKKMKSKVFKILEEAERKVESEDPEWKEITRKIEKSNIEIENFISEIWGDEI